MKLLAIDNAWERDSQFFSMLQSLKDYPWFCRVSYIYSYTGKCVDSVDLKTEQIKLGWRSGRVSLGKELEEK